MSKLGTWLVSLIYSVRKGFLAFFSSKPKPTKPQLRKLKSELDSTVSQLFMGFIALCKMKIVLWFRYFLYLINLVDNKTNQDNLRCEWLFKAGKSFQNVDTQSEIKTY